MEDSRKVEKYVENLREQKLRMMDDVTFRELLDAGEIGLIMMDGGQNLTKKQLEQVKEKAKEQAEDNLLKKKMAQAQKPAYTESQLTPVIRKLIENSSGMTPEQKKDPVEKIAQEETKPETARAETKVKASVSDKSKKTAESSVASFTGKLKGLFKKGEEKNLTPEKYTSEGLLGSIFELMVDNHEIRKLETEKNMVELKLEDLEEQRRHKEILGALKGEEEKLEDTKEYKNLKDLKKDLSKQIKDKLKKTKMERQLKGVEKKFDKKPGLFSMRNLLVLGGLGAGLFMSKGASAAAIPSVGGTRTGEPSEPGTMGTAKRIFEGPVTAAKISVIGETGARTESEAMSRSAQIVKDTKGTKSYGIFGMNTGSKTIHQFARDNPQFGLTAEPGTPEFDKQWRQAAAEKTSELYDAQLKWYDKYVLNKVKSDLRFTFPQFANDDRVVAYLADRRLQYGTVQEKEALQYASQAKNASDFIFKLTEYDYQNVDTAFKSYLRENPRNRPGLLNRITKRESLSLQVGADLGNKLAQVSKDNTELKNEIDQSKTIQKNINTTVVQSTPPAQNRKEDGEIDDTSPFHRKLVQQR